MFKPNARNSRGLTVRAVSVMAMFAAAVGGLPLSGAGVLPVSAAVPDCSPSATDYDGDGWGWEESTRTSCRMADSSSSQDSSSDSGSSSGSSDLPANHPANNPNLNHFPSCPSGTVDWDNDGWGWISSSSQSCIFRNGASSGSDSDSSNSTAVPKPTNADTVILFAGQSNAIAERTSTSDSNGQDWFNSSNGGAIYAYARSGSGYSWQVADLCDQTWDNGGWPANPTNGADCGNHPGFQMAKQLASSGQKVYLIATGEDGQPIEKWIGKPGTVRNCLNGSDPNWQSHSGSANGLSKINSRLNNALDSWVKVDVVGWMQGEANQDQTGNGLGASRYECKLKSLQDNMNNSNSRIAFGSATKFVAGYIAQSGDIGETNVNTGIEQLAQQRWWFSTYQNSRYLPTNDGVHFTSSGIRQLGRGMACRYQNANC